MPVELFVGVLGASGLLYAEATRSQDLASWVTAHVHMLEYFQGSAAIWVPDNLKSGVTRAHAHEPLVHRTYEELAHHYGAVVIPTRVARPKDNRACRFDPPPARARGARRSATGRPATRGRRSRAQMGRAREPPRRD